MKKNIGILAGVILFILPPLLMAGLATSFIDVVIDNLQPGVSYSMQNIFKMPYSVRNNGGVTSIRLTLHKSDKPFLREGFESPEDISWIRLAKTNFQDVKNGETVTSDIIISPPDNGLLIGKKFQVSIEAETFSGPGAVSPLDFAVESRLRFSIASVKIKTSQEEIDKLDFEMSCKVVPENIRITNFDLMKNSGQQIFIGTLQLTNWGQKKHTVRLKNFALKEADKIDFGFEAPPDSSFIRFSTNVVVIAPQTSKRIDAFLSFPDVKEYYGRKFQFTVSSEIEKGENLSPDMILNRIFVTTKKK